MYGGTTYIRSETKGIDMPAEVNRTIEEAHLIRLPVKDQKRFAELLLNPPPLPPALKRAKKAHARLITRSR